ncbi:MAG: pyruvate, phosphate dikinase [Peptococcaceae bacterium]|nr:pyruvate, phosphate dikinase [Peptococcaceae bacterium]
MAGEKYVYLFEEGNSGMKDLLGVKGASLAGMTNIGLPVPPGLVITTRACLEFNSGGAKFPAGLEDQILGGIEAIEKKTGKIFGGPENPLLFSIRSGTPVFIPGIADTVLNLGMNGRIAEGLAKEPGGWHFALDCYLRFLYMFSEVALGCDHRKFDEILQAKTRIGNNPDGGLSTGDLKDIVRAFRKLAESETGRPFPRDPRVQLFSAVRAVFNSWNSRRAKLYRKINLIPDSMGTAVIVQAMVFGNMGRDCGTGMVFTRNPATGADELYGEYLANTQGDDVPTANRSPRPIGVLKTEMPGVYRQFQEVRRLLERHHLNMQHVDFVIEKRKLYILHTRNGKSTIRAAVKIAADMAGSGMITREEAIVRVDAAQVDQLLHKRIKPSPGLKVIALGLPASPGAASGKVFFDPGEAEKAGRQGERVILVRTETMPDDLNGIIAARGILTSRGGMASHAAVVARAMGKPCVCGCEALGIDYRAGQFTVGRLTIKEGDYISIDGSTGQVILGEAPIVDPELSEELNQILRWCDEIRALQVRANADTPGDAEKARILGAEGIGLARTEHMFIAPDRLPIVREMILADTAEDRARALKRLLPIQRDDFYHIFKAMNGFPVTIRLLDPPLHEFLPNAGDLAVEITRLRLSGGPLEEIRAKEKLLRRVRQLSESNPMLGHRGCRLGITHPEIYAMQVRAIFEACASLAGEGYKVLPEVEIPLVVDVREFVQLSELVHRVADAVMSETGASFQYMVGTMIELPRAALLADELAEEAEFFSFGTNDLTQTALGLSRDDAEGKFMNLYLEKKILPHNPFEVLDRKGVGRLMKITVELGRKTRPDLIIGICGEQGGDPRSIEFCHRIGLDYVSCSPYRVPKARLAAAQAAIRQNSESRIQNLE